VKDNCCFPIVTGYNFNYSTGRGQALVKAPNSFLNSSKAERSGIMSFKRKVGAAADIKELEYIIALHQTCMPDTRENATVSSMDVMHLLKSRYTLTISHKQAIDVVAALGGGDNIVQEKKKAPKDKKEFIHFFRKNTGSNSQETPESKFSPAESHPDRMADDGKLGIEQVDMLKQSNGAKDFDKEEDHFVQQESAGATTSGATPESKEDTGERNGGKNLPENYLDMVQILSLLFIPSIAYFANDFWHPKPPSVPPSEPTGWAVKVFLIRRLRQLKNWANAQFLIVPQPPAIVAVRDARNILMRGVSPETVVDEAFVETLLLKHGEFERARNPRLIREMVEAAHSSSGIFDDEAFINALSSDLKQWDVDGDERLSTFFYDIFGTENPADVDRLEADDPRDSGVIDLGVDEEASNPTEMSSDHVCCKKTKSHLFKPGTYNIDFVVDSHSSLIIAVAIWAFFLFR
jgi:hypothetical protein